MSVIVRPAAMRDEPRWRETNYRARGLYDRYTPHSGFLRYVINNPDA